jgi:predicted ATP-dependent endonuclease of OLD family
MKLRKVRVLNFKCVIDSSEFSIDERITCLVGKNESGKTALLQAIEKINPLDAERRQFDELDYPCAHLSEYRERAEENPDDALLATWELDDEDVQALEEYVGKGVVESRTFVVRKGYYESTYWEIKVDEKVALQNLLEEQELHDEERKQLLAAGTLDAARKALTAKKEKADDKGGEVRSSREQSLLERLNEEFSGRAFWNNVVNFLQDRMPHIVYFYENLRMPGQISLNDLRDRTKSKTLDQGHKVFLALLSMISATPESLEEIGEFERMTRELEAASQRLTREIFSYWRQNRLLRVQFRFEQGLAADDPPFNNGFVMRTRIENQRHGATTSFDERSSGFVWFFSFLVWFNQARRNYGKRLVFLLDEPGLGLHASAQNDLLRYINDKLAAQFQVIYTTHSPFMIEPSNLSRARTVEDFYVEATKDQEALDYGTKVGDQVLSADADTLFPLRAALGYEITQTLFVGEHALLVEGPSELLYLPWFSRRLEADGRTALDRRWTLTPCGGIDKVPAFLSLFAGQRLHIAILVDFAEGQKKTVGGLRKSELLKSGHVLSAEMYAGQPEADVEDIIGRELYVHLVNGCYELAGKKVIPSKKPSGAPDRALKEVEEHFRTVATSGAEFNHFRPAEFLNRQPLDWEPPGLEAALNRFEKLFTDLNAMLPAT